jgi:hypothetical protein
MCMLPRRVKASPSPTVQTWKLRPGVGPVPVDRGHLYAVKSTTTWVHEGIQGLGLSE